MGNEKNDSRQWFLRIAGGTVFGPVSTKGLIVWAEQGRVVPGNEISEDRESWMPAEQIPELEMTWYVEDGTGKTVGPFNRVAAEAFLKNGKAPPGARLADSKQGKVSSSSARQESDPLPLFARSAPEDSTPAPAHTPRRVNEEPDAQSARVCELERALEKQKEMLALARQAARAQTALEEERDELRKQMQNIQTQMENLKSNAEKDAKARERKLESMKQEIARLQQERSETALQPIPADEATLLESHAGSQDVSGAIEELRRQAQDEHRTMEREAETLRGRIAELENALAQKARSEAQVQDASKALRAELESRTEAFTSQLAQRDAECDKLIKERDLLQRQLGAAMNAAAAATNNRGQESAELLRRLEQVQAVNEGLKSELVAADKSLEEERAAKADLLETANTRDVASRQRIEELEKAREALETQIRDMPPPNERETRLMADLAQARTRIVELQGRIARQPESDSAHDRAPRPVESTSWLRQLATDELTTLDKALHAERESFNAFRQLSTSRQSAIQSRIQTMQQLLSGTASDGRPRSAHDRIAAVDHSRLQNEVDSLRHEQERESRQFEEREAELLRRIRVLETEEARLRTQIDASDMQGGRMHELVETVRRREQDLALELRNREQEREQFQSARQALLKRIEELERQTGVSVSPISERFSSSEGSHHGSEEHGKPRTGLSSWLRIGR